MHTPVRLMRNTHLAFFAYNLTVDVVIDQFYSP